MTYINTIGTIANSGKVHLAHGSAQQAILCRFGHASKTIDRTIAEIPEGTDVCDVLRAHRIAAAKLCANCFSVGLRKRYASIMRNVPHRLGGPRTAQ